MEEELTFGVYVPSYNRYNDKVRMYDYLEYCTYVVRKSEEKLYREKGIDNLWVVEDEKIDDLWKVHQYILDNSPEDIIVIIDDDGKMIYRNITSYDMSKEEASAELERVAQIMVDLNIGYGCTGATPMPYNYDAEFGFKCVSGGCKWFYKKCFKAKIDANTFFNFDCDLELQELLKNRIILSPKYFIDIGGQDTNKGGSNTDKNSIKRKSGIEYMKLKWGKYFDYNNNNNNKPRINVKR